MKQQIVKMFAVAAFVAVSVAAHAAQPFDQKTFDAAQADSKSILIDVFANWCPTCGRQKPIIESLEEATPQLVVFFVDFDNAKPVLQRFRVRYQSTLIVFKGKAEVARSTGETDPAAIDALIRKGL